MVRFFKRASAHPPSVDMHAHDDDDEGTLSSCSDYSDTASTYSDSSSFIDSSRNNWTSTAPDFALDENDGQKPVYEAWNIRVNKGGRRDVWASIYEQSELMEKHVSILAGYQARHKRCWPSRLLRCKSKAYEENLEERCRRLPRTIQDGINAILEDRGSSSSTSTHTRVWTVVVMQEQLINRFVDTDLPEVKRHKVRVWKNPGRREQLQYFCVIRGSETRTCADKKGYTISRPFSNPWVHVDEAETRHNLHQERLRRSEERMKKRSSPPSYRSESLRSRSPPPRRAMRVEESEHEGDFSEDRHEIRPSVSHNYGRPSVPIPPYGPHWPYGPPPPAPPPPGHFPTPPPVAQYKRPSAMIPPPAPPLPPYPAFSQSSWKPTLPTSNLDPFRPLFPSVPYHRDSCRYYGVSELPMPTVYPPTTAGSCQACRNTLICGHFPQDGPCFRSILSSSYGLVHPRCHLCSPPPRPPFSPPFPPPVNGADFPRGFNTPPPPPLPHHPVDATPNFFRPNMFRPRAQVPPRNGAWQRPSVDDYYSDTDTASELTRDDDESRHSEDGDSMPTTIESNPPIKDDGAQRTGAESRPPPGGDDTLQTGLDEAPLSG
ncbi:hypothetical protein B0T22DRAFT_212341 [Podospora appendiculata]|uniref:Uncharacterized protein n=1 Tax=Podospora appendiculata TaxID=314037 RepID=A0AAE0X4P1_9PEZI|nr:hypothetical protein B0T22DRAFT_212341 [Podospora appendiculata]